MAPVFQKKWPNSDRWLLWRDRGKGRGNVLIFEAISQKIWHTNIRYKAQNFVLNIFTLQRADTHSLVVLRKLDMSIYHAISSPDRLVPLHATRVISFCAIPDQSKKAWFTCWLSCLIFGQKVCEQKNIKNWHDVDQVNPGAILSSLSRQDQFLAWSLLFVTQRIIEKSKVILNTVIVSLVSN